MSTNPQSASRLTETGQPLSRWTEMSVRLFEPVDIGLIVFFRIIFGGMMLVELGRFAAHGWIRSLFIDPPFHFTFYGFSWVQPWPGDGMYWHFAALAVCALLMVLGLYYRLAAVLFFLGITYVFLLDQALYLNHMYFICLLSFLAIFLPADRKWSLDVWRRPQIRSETAPAWTLWLLRFQVGVVYFFGGIAKLDADWLNGSSMKLMLSTRPDFPLIGQFFAEEWMVMFFVWGGLLLDLFIVPLLLWSRTRTAAYVACVFFHATNARLFQIGIFPLLMIAATMLFFPADSLRRKKEADETAPGKSRRRRGRLSVKQKLSGKGGGHAGADSLQSGSVPAGVFPRLSGRQKWVAGLLGVYVAVQLLVPLRHWLYPGRVNWTEEGHRFSWHMKLRVKRATCTFRAVDEKDKPINLRPFETVLTDRQRRSMAGRPDMLLQYAHYLAARLQRAGYDNVSIFADTAVSLNNRPPQKLVDPTVNLAEVKRSLRHAGWILPLKD